MVALRVGQPDTFWRGGIPLILGMLGTLVYGWPFARWLIGMTEAAFGHSPGKWLAGLTVRANEPEKPPEPARPGPLLLRALVRNAPAGIFCLSLLLGRWEGLALSLVLAGVQLVDGLLASPARPSAPDRLAGTRLARRPKTPPAT